MEVENNVLQCKRIGITFHLTASEEDREAIERVLEVYEDACPVAATVKAAIEINSELDLAAR
jgi:uncharacterized OsmC-like protein